MILVYTHTITPRIAYAMDLVFGNVLNTVHKLTDNKKEFDEFMQKNYPKKYCNVIVYCRNKMTKPDILLTSPINNGCS